MIPIGIVCYRYLDDVKAAVESVLKYTPDPKVLLFDNTENLAIACWAYTLPATVTYRRSPYNVGCSVARNRIAERFIREGHERFVIMDQDVRFVGDAVSAMSAVVDKYPDTGIVSWKLFARQMGSHPTDATGAVTEMPGACCLYTAACVKAVGGWSSDMFMYRFDTVLCLVAGKRGFKTRIVMPDADLVRHDHPHRGVSACPRLAQERAHSQRVFLDVLAREGIACPPELAHV